MLRTLDQIVARLVEGYDPDRVILFGSRARGTSTDDSDFDLLVVKETDERPADRRFRVEKLLSDRETGIDLLVYTPEELRQLYSMGSPFIEEVMEEGRLLYMRKATAAWLAEAREDLESSRILLEHEKYRGGCVHAQQSAEKALKSLLLERGVRPARTHDILELLKAVRSEGCTVDLSMDDAVYLNSIYRGRYPTEEGLLPLGEPREEDARHAHSAAAALLASVTAQLQ